MPVPVPSDNLADLERQRLELEKNVLQLQQSLYHWRLWEAEYDALKEEISSLSDESTKADFLKTGREFGGSVVTEDEVKALLGEGQGVSRTKEQIVQLIARRIDYVKQNVSTMEKRLRAAEDKRDALITGEQPAVVGEGEYAMTEIMEELDEEGRVISSSMSTPGKEAPELLEILKKAGVKDVPDKPGATTETSEKENSLEKMQSEGDKAGNKGKIQVEDKAKERKPEEIRKAEEEQKLVDQPKPAPSQTNGTSTALDKKPASAATQKDVKEPEENPVPVTDVDESSEDAKLRREMLAYGLNEVGAVVAELELDEDGSEISIEDDYDSYEDYDSKEEEEDEHGRTTTRVLTEDYHKQMRELEEKLNARGMQNIGRDIGSLPEELRRDLEEPRVVKIQKEPEVKKEKKPKKKVTFADALDIAPEPAPPKAKEKKKTGPRAPEVNPIADSIVERTTAVNESQPETKAPKKTSRFKSARSSGAAPPPDAVPSVMLSTSKASTPVRERPVSTRAPSLPLFPAKAEKPFSRPIVADLIADDVPSRSEPRPPKGITLADTLVERETSGSTAAPPEPDELDEQLHRQEIATEFYKMSNRVIHQNGGFLNDDEQEIVPLDDAPGQPTKKVSRFMAARMK